MKRFFIISIFFIISYSISAQNDTLINTRYTLKSQYLLNSFVNGEVILKTGLRVNTDLNYNIFTEEIYYLKNNQLFEITNKEDIKSINMHNFKFLYVNNKYFIEIYNNDNTSILKKITIVENNNDKRVGMYGVNSETTAVSKVNVLDQGYLGSLQINIFDEKEPEYKTITDYYILFENKLYDLKLKYIKRIFKEKDEQIEKFIKDNNLKLNQENDIKILFDFILGE